MAKRTSGPRNDGSDGVEITAISSPSAGLSRQRPTSTAGDAIHTGIRRSPSPAGPPEVPGFDILSRIGEGGMGTVYLATHRVLQRQVAIKVLKPQLAEDPLFVERFLREARLAASIAHPNVVTVSDAGRADELLYIVLEYVAGGDLGKVLKKRKRLPEQDALRTIEACALGLGAIHKAGLVHRDIKPDNILFDLDEVPKIADLGIARSIGGDDRMTGTGTTLGTPQYMSPEQARGLADIDARADIYSLGATLYVLLTGKAPFTGSTPYETVHHILSTDAPDVRASNPRLTAQAAAIVRCCLMKEREERYASALELHADLAAARAGLPLPSQRDVAAAGAAQHPAQLKERLAARLASLIRWRTWTRLQLAIAVAATALLAVLLIATAFPGPPDHPPQPPSPAQPVPLVQPAEPAAPAQPKLTREERLARAREQSEAASPGVALKRSLRGTFVNIALDTVDNLDLRCLKVLHEIGLLVDRHVHDRLAAELSGRFVDGDTLHVTLRRINDDATEVSIQIGILGDKIRSEALFSDITR
jgi:eukaryotic-like serine/threonine-protein kinase